MAEQFKQRPGDRAPSGRSALDYNQLATDYARHRRIHPGVLQSLIETAQLTRSTRVLEVGCGTGNYSHALADQVGCAVVGIDPSLQMLEQARARSGRAVFSVGQAERLELAEASRDLIFSVDVIHHVADRPAYFAEARRVLTMGGWLVTVTDSAEMIARRRPLANYFPETVAHELQRYPAIEQLRAEMTAAGFGALTEQAVEVQYDLTDARAYRDRAFSSLHLIDQAAFERGLARLEADLDRGPVACLSLYCLLWGRKA